MARLAAAARMGYYPTPETLTPIIARYLKRQKPGPIRIFDPCAGEGIALKTIAEHLDAEAYGIELDRKRGRQAKKKFTKCLITDNQSVIASRGFASLLFLNPPYDWSAKETALEKSERYERTFLRDTIKYLMPRGILVYLIPLSRLDSTIARMLAYRFEKIRIYKFPEDLFQQFRQIILFAALKTAPAIDEIVCEFLASAGESREDIAFLPPEPEIVYEVPCSPKLNHFIFRTTEIDLQELEAEVAQYGLDGELKEMLTPLSMAEKITSIMPLRHGHLAQLIACGFINGVVFDKNHRNPLVVKGVTKKIVEPRVEIEGDREKHIETDRIVITINAFTETGDLITIQS